MTPAEEAFDDFLKFLVSAPVEFINGSEELDRLRIRAEVENILCHRFGVEPVITNEADAETGKEQNVYHVTPRMSKADAKAVYNACRADVARVDPTAAVVMSYPATIDAGTIEPDGGNTPAMSK